MRSPIGQQKLLIFGATGGIGRALCAEAAQAGASGHVVARTEGSLKDIAATTGWTFSTADVTDPQAVEAAFDAAAAALGTIDGVVLSVGSILLKPVHRTSDADWRDTLSRNLDAAFYVLRTATKRMQRSGGSIVLISTAAAHAGVANHAAIAAAKSGVEGLVRASAATYAARGLRINAVAPGLVETPLAAPLLRTDASRKASERLHGLGRIGQPDDIAHAIRFLLESTWTTGQVITVDGGLSGVKVAR